MLSTHNTVQVTVALTHLSLAYYHHHHHLDLVGLDNQYCMCCIWEYKPATLLPFLYFLCARKQSGLCVNLTDTLYSSYSTPLPAGQ